jgi:serine/threonine protein kinase
LAKQISLDRLVAVKILGPSLTQAADKARFLREAQAVAKLKHPNIASVHYIGQDSHVCYYAMEYIDGVSLRTVIESLRTSHDPHLSLETALHSSWTADSTSEEIRFDDPTGTLHLESNDQQSAIGPGEISPEARRLFETKEYIRRCCEIIKTVALALTHAHERGVIHRDIKPENILLDRSGNAYVIDFGLARFFEDATVTETGALLGTPMYMSPEQVSGRLTLDHRTDIYSLGIVLYEMLTLRRPISSSTREGILRQIATKAMIPLTWKNKAVPRDSESVVHKAIAKDPDERYQTAAELSEDLQCYLCCEPVSARPYQYRFDDHALMAERPGGITLISFELIILSSTFLPRFSSDLESLFDGLQNRVDISWTVYSILADVFLFCLLCVVGIRLMKGSMMARLLSIICVSFVISYVIICVAIYYYRNELTYYLIIIYLTFYILILLPIYYLLHRRTRDWFRLAERLRAEHRQHRPSAR